MSETTVHISHRQINCAMTVAGAGKEQDKLFRVSAILDTGAMSCCINDVICKRMGLSQYGTTRVGGANGEAEVPLYRARVGISGLIGFEREVEVIGLSTRTALLGYSLFSQLDRIDINLANGNVVFHSGENSVTH